MASIRSLRYYHTAKGKRSTPIAANIVHAITQDPPKTIASFPAYAKAKGITQKQLREELGRQGIYVPKKPRTLERPPLTAREHLRYSQEATFLLEDYLPRFIRRESYRHRISAYWQEELKAQLSEETLRSLRTFRPVNAKLASFKTYAVTGWQNTLRDYLDGRAEFSHRIRSAGKSEVEEKRELADAFFSNWKSSRFDEMSAEEYEYARKHFREKLQLLSAREQLVIIMRFGLSKLGSFTLNEIASRLDVTKERVRQIQVKAILKMQQPLPDHTMAWTPEPLTRGNWLKRWRARKLSETQREVLHIAIKQLPKPESDALFLSEGIVTGVRRTFQEAARKLRISPAEARSRSARAVRILRAIMCGEKPYILPEYFRKRST